MINSNIIQVLKSSSNFDELMAHINNSIAGEAHCLDDLSKMNNKKLVGDMWERFCALYLKNSKKFVDVFLWRDFPFLNYPQIPKITDHGIDIICVTKSGQLVAVQCKYRHTKTGVVGWRELSTFYSLALKLGCFDELIVMTSGKYVKYITRLDNETSLCYRNFSKLNSMDFLELCGCSAKEIDKNVLPSETQKLSLEELRQYRLAYYKNNLQI
jgi:predicted helicase